MDAAPRRTCATCCSFDNGDCMNGLGDVNPGDRCGQHETAAEFDADVAALERFRIAIGLSPRMGE